MFKQLLTLTTDESTSSLNILSPYLNRWDLSDILCICFGAVVWRGLRFAMIEPLYLLYIFRDGEGDIGIFSFGSRIVLAKGLFPL